MLGLDAKVSGTTDGSPPTPVPDGSPSSPPPVGAKGTCLPDPGLRLCLTFEGAVVDESSSRLEVDARQVSLEPGPTGMAARVGPGSDMHIDQGLSGLAATTVTLEAWVRPDQLPPASQRAGIIDRDGHYGLFLLPGGAVGCSANGATVMASAGVRAGEWSSIACTASSAALGIWVNGTRRASGPAGVRVPGPPASPISVGSNSPAGENLTGLIDNVRIWSRDRSAQEICQTALGCE